VTEALEVVVTAPVASFRNPLYAGVQVGLPCPPPTTIAGMLAAAAGGWRHMPERTRFAACFVADGKGVDLETYHPLDAQGAADPTPKDREFLAHVTLTLWLREDLELWERALRRPVWALRFGRSQDLASARTCRVGLTTGPGRQGQAIVPDDLTSAGTLLRLPTAVSIDRSRTRWDAYRYAATHGDVHIDSAWATDKGQAVVFLESAHPFQFAGRGDMA
jgi:CRISPR-associated Cas5-like protein